MEGEGINICSCLQVVREIFKVKGWVYVQQRVFYVFYVPETHIMYYVQGAVDFLKFLKIAIVGG